MLNEKIQIFLVTYNRSEKLNATFLQIFDKSSPIKDFDITVLDNNSTDDTFAIVKKYQQMHKNLKYIKHNYNIGANANVARAYELSNKEYLWILCDDDNYNFASWAEVENAIENQEDMIMVSKYALPQDNINPVHLLIQATFTPSIILNKKLLDDTVLRNIYDNIYTMYPQLVPVVMALNENKEIYLINGEAIVENGYDYGVKNSAYYHSPNYHRGAQQDRLYYKNSQISQPVGIVNAIEPLKDITLKNAFMKYQINSALYYFKPFSKDFMFFADFWANLSTPHKIKCMIKLFKIDRIFSICKSATYIDICFLGMKTHLFGIKNKRNKK